MKQKSSFVTIAGLAVAASAVMLSGCLQPSTGPDSSSGALIKPSPARPALTYYGTVTNHDTAYSAIFVMDADATHQTVVLVSGSSTVQYSAPGWSPTGQSICFTQMGYSTGPDTIKTIDVNVGSAGFAEGSNLRAIFGLPDTNTRMTTPFWSSTTAMGKIAFTAGNGATRTLYVVSQSGGTPTSVWSGHGVGMGFCTWSPDDSRLAVVRFDSSCTIMIFNTSSWEYIDSIKLNGTAWGLEWSRSGLNKLVFGMTPSSTDPYYLYYCDPVTGAIPVTNGVVGRSPTWSPDNSSILYDLWGATGLYHVIPFTPFSLQVDPTMGAIVKWKR